MIRHFRVLVLLMFMLLVSMEQVRAQHLLEGVVLDEASGEPLVAAAVEIPEANAGTVTDSDGLFRFESLEPGEYVLRISYLGFHPVELSVPVPHPDERPEFRLTPDPAILEEVIVTSSPLGRSIRYQPTQALNRETLQEKAAPSLGEMLDGSSGVSMRSFGSAPARPVIRGLDGDRVLLLQNGERMGDLSATAHDHAVALDPLAIDRIEVVRGPASLLYGSSAMGGVVNLFSYHMPREWSAGSDFSLATHLATVNRLGAMMMRGQHATESWALSARAGYRDAGNVRTPEGSLPGSYLNSYSVGGGGGYRTGNLETGISLEGMSYQYGLPEELEDPDEEIHIGMNRFNIQSYTKLEMDGFFTLGELRVQYNDYSHDEVEVERLEDGTFEEGIGLGFHQRSVSSSLTLRHRPSGRMEGAVGLSAHWRDIQVSGEELLTPDARSYFLAGYLYEEYTLGKGFTLLTGARLELQGLHLRENRLFEELTELPDREDLIVSGSAGLNYRAGRQWELGVQLARAYRTPSLEELYSDAPHVGAGAYETGDPSLKTETSLGSDLFINYRSDRLTLQLSGFLNRIDDFVKYTPVGQIHEPTGLPMMTYRGSDVLLYGVEISGEWIINSDWSAGAGFDAMIGRERDDALTPLPFMPPGKSHFSLRYDPGRWWMSGTVRFISSQSRVAPHEETTAGYSLLVVQSGYRFNGGLTLNLRLDNALDVSYRDHLTRIEERNNPMPGRNLNLSLRWDL